jgi:predicted lipoprotein with Yx(FWY)xxD motif
MHDNNRWFVNAAHRRQATRATAARVYFDQSTTWRLVAAAAMLAALLLVAVQPASAIGSLPAYEQTDAAAGTAVAVGQQAEFGEILVDASGMTLYMFDNDANGESTCYGGCAERWPPLLVDAGMQPSAGEGVTASLNVSERDDGTFQVTANNMPLYYWYEDEAPGDANGQAVGEVWWILAPDGTVIRTAADGGAGDDVAAADTGDTTTDAGTDNATGTSDDAAAGAGASAVTGTTDDALGTAGDDAAASTAADATTGTTDDALGQAPPQQLPVTGGVGTLLVLAVTALVLLAGGGWVVLRRAKQ